MREYHWTEVLGSPFLLRPTTEMINAINENGHWLRVCNVSVEGESHTIARVTHAMGSSEVLILVAKHCLTC